MQNPQHPIDYGPLTGTGIHYFRAPINSGPEVRFPRPPVVTKPLTEPVIKKHASPPRKPLTVELPSEPKEEYKGYAYYELQRAKRRLIAHQCLAIVFLASFFIFPRVIEFLLVKYGPAPSPGIIPPPPYYVGETIKGLSTKGEYHTWVYTSTNLWVDP